VHEQERSGILTEMPEGIGEEELLGQGTVAAIREMRLRGKPKKAIARELGLDIKTVRKWSAEEWSPQQRPARGVKLAEFDEVIRRRFPEVGYNAMVLYRELTDAGYEGSYVSVRRYVKPLRELAQPESATARFETAPGEQAQVDWGMLGVWIGEARVTIHLFVMVLGFSRRIFVRAYEHERLGNLLEGHEAAFARFGGRTATLLYDNPRTIVLSKDEASGTIEWNRRFKDRMDFYGAEVKLCRYYRAQTKGKVESGVKYVKRNALAGRRFATFEDLNAWLDRWALTVADQRIHGTMHEQPCERFEREERAKMIAVDARPPARESRMTKRRVSRDAFVEVETNRYPVPFGWCQAEVSVELTPSEVRVVHEDEPPLLYEREPGRHRVVRWQGVPRTMPPNTSADSPADPPRFDPSWLARVGQVAARPLDAYAALASEVLS
jgi:transposase